MAVSLILSNVILSIISNISNTLTPSKYNLEYWFAIYSGEFKLEINSPINCFSTIQMLLDHQDYHNTCLAHLTTLLFNLSGYCVALVIIEKQYVGSSTN